MKGSATVAGSPLRLDLSVGAKNPDGYPTDLALEAVGGKLAFKGYADRARGDGPSGRHGLGLDG